MNELGWSELIGGLFSSLSLWGVMGRAPPNAPQREDKREEKNNPLINERKQNKFVNEENEDK